VAFEAGAGKHSYVISAQQHNSKIRHHELEIQVHLASVVRVSFFGGNISSANFRTGGKCG
jgi:hypothetical protein